MGDDARNSNADDLIARNPIAELMKFGSEDGVGKKIETP